MYEYLQRTDFVEHFYDIYHEYLKFDKQEAT